MTTVETLVNWAKDYQESWFATSNNTLQKILENLDVVPLHHYDRLAAKTHIKALQRLTKPLNSTQKWNHEKKQLLSVLSDNGSYSSISSRRHKIQIFNLGPLYKLPTKKHISKSLRQLEKLKASTTIVKHSLKVTVPMEKIELSDKTVTAHIPESIINLTVLKHYKPSITHSILDDNSSFDQYSHPHVNIDGFVCLGKIRNQVNTLAPSLYITETIDIIKSVLRGYKEIDAYTKLEHSRYANFLCQDCGLSSSEPLYKCSVHSISYCSTCTCIKC